MEEVDATVRESTLRYACEETSEASPFLVDNHSLGSVLFVMDGGATSREEIAEGAGLSLSDTVQALRRAVDLGYATWNPRSGENKLTPLGQTYLDAWQARRVTDTESDVHMDGFARVSEHAREAWGAEIIAVSQGSSSSPLPDGRFERDDIRYNVEIECSTIASKIPQVVKNLRKARDDRARCLFGVPTRQVGAKLVATVTEHVPEAVLGVDYAVVAWSDGFCTFPNAVPPGGFPFAAPSPEPERIAMAPAPAVRTKPVGPATSRGPTDDDVARSAVDTLVAQGLRRFTRAQFLEVLPEGERWRFPGPPRDPKFIKLGLALKRLGLTSSKEWVKEVKDNVLFYDVPEDRPPDPGTTGGSVTA